MAADKITPDDLKDLRKAMVDLTNAVNNSNVNGDGKNNPYKYNTVDELEERLNKINSNGKGLVANYAKKKLEKEIRDRKDRDVDINKYGYDRTTVRNELGKLITDTIINIGDNIVNYFIAGQRNVLSVSKNSFTMQQSFARAELELAKKQGQVVSSTMKSFTSQLATNAAFGVYKSSGDEAIAKLDKITKINVAKREFGAAETQRETEMLQQSSTAIHGIAATLIGVGLALAPATAGISTALVVAAGVVEAGYAVTKWISGFRKVDYERQQQVKEQYKEQMELSQNQAEFVKNVVDSFDDVVKDLTEFIRENDKFYKQIGASVGFTGDEYSMFARNISAQVSEIFGITSQQMQSIMNSYTSTSSRTQIMGADEFNNIVATGKLFGMSEGETASLYGEMNVFNTSIESGANMFGEMYKTITKMGLSTSKFAKDLNNNLKLAQKYNFKGGVENMMKLTKWAQQTRFNLNKAASFADSIMNDSLSGALEKSAKLQVLGGSAAMYSDPLGMLYDAGADVGNMAQRMAGMFNDITGTFNKKTGETDFSWYENRMIAARAQALGMDPGEVKNMIRQNNKQGVINRELNGTDLSKEDKLAIGNRATYIEGKGWMVNTLEGQKSLQQVADMSSEERERVLLPENEEDAIIDIAKNVRSIKEKEEAKKITLQSEKQPELYTGVEKLSEDSMKAQETIFHDKNFVENANETLTAISENAIIQAQSVVDFFDENSKLIKDYREFVQNSITESKKVSDLTANTMAIMGRKNGQEIMSDIATKIAEANNEGVSNNEREKLMEELWKQYSNDPVVKTYLRDRFGEYDKNGDWDRDRIKPQKDGYGSTNGGIILGASKVKSISDGAVNVKTSNRDQYLAAETGGPIDILLKQILPGLQMLINGNGSSNGNVNLNLNGKLELSQNGSSVNLVDMIKNDPATATKFLAVLQKTMEVNQNGKSVTNHKIS